jgi:adenosylcobinamide-phosphate synthase
MAGALGVQFGGRNVYGGVAELRARIGDPVTPCCLSNIPVALQLMGLACGFVVMMLLGWVMW